MVTLNGNITGDGSGTKPNAIKGPNNNRNGHVNVAINLNGDSCATREHEVSIGKNELQRNDSMISTKSRGNWGSKWEFLLSCVGLSVGIGNVWRFPYLAYENGGGAFLIPYLIMLFLAGKPMYFMELAFGQFAGSGPLSIWKCSPIAKGVGAAMVCVSAVIIIYYNVVMSYALYYIGSSFQKELPWNRCDPSWANGTACFVRISGSNSANITTNGTSSSSQVFWERKVLDITSGIEDLGGVKWDLALCLLISWILVILCLIKGVKTSGKVVYFAATFPYVILITLLIAGLTQKGAFNGVLYFITPTWSKLLSIKVWQMAASQMFYSLSVSMGSLIIYSSYNDFRHNIFKDAMVVSVLDTVTSIISGCVIFSVLGAMSYEMGLDMKDVVKGGPGLAFVAYPEALSRLPIPHLWSVLFFIMLFILGLDSEFAMLETVLSGITDEVEILRRHKMKFTIGVGVLFFFLGLPCVTRGGQYVFQIMDYYGSASLVVIAVFECIAVNWLYGYKNIATDIYFMLNRDLGFYWQFTWKFTSPFILAFIAIYSFINHKPLTYNDYDFPTWADVIGWLLLAFILLQIPIWAVIAISKQTKGNTFFEKVKMAIKSTDRWGPKDNVTRDDWRQMKNGLKSISIVKMDSNEPAILNRFKRISGTENCGYKSDDKY